jgi:hypothetical protein
MNLTLAIECMWNCVKTHLPDFIIILLTLNGFLSAIVKITPTLPAKHPLLNLIKLLARLTNDQTDNEASRKQMQNGGQK